MPSTFAISVPLMASITPGANRNLTPASRCSVWCLAIMAVCITSHTASLICSVLSMYPPWDSTLHWPCVPGHRLATRVAQNTTQCCQRDSIVRATSHSQSSVTLCLEINTEGIKINKELFYHKNECYSSLNTYRLTTYHQIPIGLL